MRKEEGMRGPSQRLGTLFREKLQKVAIKYGPARRAVRLAEDVLVALKGGAVAREELEAALAQQRETAQQFAESEARFREVFMRAPNPLAIARVSDAHIYDVNDAFAQKAGYTRDQILNGASADLPWWPEAEGERILGLLREQGYLRDTEVRVIDGNGEERIVLVSANPIVMAGQACVIWQTVDVTELHRADQMRAELDRRNREKDSLERLGMLAGGIAHDFNNLLVGILGNADLVLYRLPPDSPLRPPVQSIVLSAQRAAEHTCELLDYAGRSGAKLKPLRFDTLLSEIIELARPLVRPPSALHWKPSDAPVWIHGDAGQLTRTVINLIKNSAESLEGAQGEARLSLELARTEHNISVRIRDEGRGMDEATRKRMFEPFFSTKRSGCGLGLASVPAIIERHAGQIEVESAPGQGTTVSLLFAACPAPPPATIGVASAGSPLGSGRVLVVDDEAMVRSTAAAMLTRLGYEVLEAESGLHALKLISDDPHGFSLVLLDATMPGLDGAQTLAKLRVLAPELPVLLCSGYSRTDFTQVLGEQSCVSFLTKPCRADELGAAIQLLLAELS